MRVQIEKISKAFQKKRVVEDLTFSLHPGRIVGLLGPNGAGKTTTLRIILDILKPDKGLIRFDDRKMDRKIGDRIGYLPEERGLYQKYSILDVLIYFARLKNLSRKKSHVEAVRLLDAFDMIDHLEEPIGHLSKGTQQKLQFLVSLIHNPDILIMDEPMWGLDPMNQDLIKNKLFRLRDEGKTILISTHQLAEAESMCDQFVMIHQGKMVLQGSLEKIRKNFYQNMIILEMHQNPDILKKLPHVKKIDISDSLVHLYLDGNAPVKDVMQQIINLADVQRLEIHRPSLHDIFIQTIKSNTP
ncbi:MAG: ATP-binding cassette domain-containing protein [Calditrichaeota bacterium]|nr:ATP-binding cassette domain-containing protein [Calditrichota bacterium]RQV92501.1 MAG: ATP-binding cassette domain-containing protein [bacterium]RQV99357.1 MAG: ATP-binding cassette domain-containing protein [Calditrichota bacterium]